MRQAAAVVVALVAAGAAAAAAVDDVKFRYERTVTAQGAAEPLAFEPDGPMLFHARESFGDLRVLDANGVQVPWRLVPELETVPRSVDVLNTGRSGKEASALLDLGAGPAAYDRIELEIPDRLFVGRVRVSGSDRRLGPFRLLSTTGIYAIQGARDARSTTAVLPRSDFRYLELAASNVSRIAGATVSGSEERTRLTQRRYALVPGRGASGSASGESLFTLDFGTRGVPVTELELSSSTRTYERPLRIEGSNDRRAFVPLASARVFRFRGSTSAPVTFDSRFRYLRVAIENGDDPRLARVRLRARGPSRAILLEPGHKPPFRLLYGGPGVPAPSYEFARIPAPEPKTMLPSSRLGPERANEAFEPPADTRPFTERHPVLIQLALGLAAAALVAAGFFAVRRRSAE